MCSSDLKKLITKLFIFQMLFSFCATVYAEIDDFGLLDGIYFGGDIGQSSGDFYPKYYKESMSVAGYSSSYSHGNHYAYKLYAGKSLDGFTGIDIEGGYVNLGDLNLKVQAIQPPDEQLFLQEAVKLMPLSSVSGFYLSSVFKLPITRAFNGMIKLGAFIWDGESELKGTSVSQVRKESGIGPLIGIGGSYLINHRFRFNGNIEKYSVGNTNENGYFFYSMGVSYLY